MLIEKYAPIQSSFLECDFFGILDKNHEILGVSFKYMYGIWTSIPDYGFPQVI